MVLVEDELAVRAVPFSWAAGSISTMVMLLPPAPALKKRTGLFLLSCLGRSAK
jgi:hypothetical protein